MEVPIWNYNPLVSKNQQPVTTQVSPRVIKSSRYQLGLSGTLTLHFDGRRGARGALRNRGSKGL